MGGRERGRVEEEPNNMRAATIESETIEIEVRCQDWKQDQKD
jgi:hypothetical protein